MSVNQKKQQKFIAVNRVLSCFGKYSVVFYNLITMSLNAKICRTNKRKKKCTRQKSRQMKNNSGRTNNLEQMNKRKNKNVDG